MSNDRFTVGTNQYALIKSALMGYTGSAYIRELIQNASDSRKKSSDKVTITFDFCKDRLIVENNMKFSGDFDNLHKNMTSYCNSQGDMDLFDEIKNKIKDDDWARICIQRGDLKNLDKQHNIGRFGIGFRSVFRICDEPIVESDSRQICFKGVEAQLGHSRVKNTRFTFKYRLSKTRVGEEIGAGAVTPKDLENYYQDALNSRMLILFLENIDEVNILKDSKPIKRIVRKSQGDEIEIKEIDQAKKKETRSLFKVFGNKNSSTKLIFPFDESDRLYKHKIYSWFPTKYETSLPFFINADFEVDDGRDYFNKNESEFNNRQLETCGQIFIENIERIKELFETPYIFYDFLIFRYRLPEDISVLKSVIQNGLKDKNFSIVHTKLGWRNFKNSYFIEPHLIGSHSELVFLFEKNEGGNYFDCYQNSYFEDYYDFLNKLQPIDFFGREKLLSYLSKIPIGKKITDSQIEKISNLIQIYKYLINIGAVNEYTKQEKIKEIRNLPIFLDSNQLFSSYSNLYKIPSYLSDIAKLFNIRASYISKEYQEELTRFYKELGLAEFSIPKIVEIIKSFNISEGLSIQKAQPPLNEPSNLILMLKTVSKESKDLKVPLLLDTENRIHYTNSSEIYVIRNDDKLEQFFIKWGIPILHGKFIEFGYLAKNFNIVHFLKILETKHEKMTKDDLINAYSVINSYRQDIRNDQSKIDLLFGLPIFYTTGNKKVCLKNEEVFFLDFDGYKPEKDIFIDKSIFESDQLEGFREFLLHIGAKKYNYNEFVKKYLEEIFINAPSNKRVEILKQLLDNHSQLDNNAREVVKRIPLFNCSDKKYHSSEEGVFFKDEYLTDVFGEQLKYIVISEQLLSEHEQELENLGVLKHPTGKFLASAISSFEVKKDVDRLLKVIGYLISNYDAFKDDEDLDSVRGLACIPDHNLSLRRGEQIYSLDLRNELDELDNISFLHKDLHNLNPKAEFRDFFSINSKAPTELIVENLMVSVKKNRIKDYSAIYRRLNDRVKENPHQLQKLLEFSSIAIPIHKNNKVIEIHFYKPSRIFRESTHLDKIGSKYVEVLPKEYGQFLKIFEFLNVKTMIDIETMMLILEEIKSKAKLEEPDKKVIQNIYRIISELVKNKDSRVNQLSGYTAKEIILVNNEFKKPSEVFLNDNNEIADLFAGTNVENLILPIDPDVKHFYHEVGISLISQVRKFSTHEFKNQESSKLFTEKVQLVYSSREEILALTRRDMKGDDDYLDLVESKIEKFKALEVFIAYEIVVDVSIPGIIIKPAINRKSVKSLVNEDKIYLSKKMNKVDQIQRFSKEVSYYIFGDEIHSFLLKDIINCQDKAQVKKLFSETLNLVLDDAKGYDEVEDSYPINTPIETTADEVESEPTDTEDKKKDVWGEEYDSETPEKTPIEESDITDSEEGTDFRKGRTDSPTEKTDFKEKVKKTFDGKVARAGQSSAIKDKEEPEEPLSLEQEQAYENNLRKELKDEIHNIRDQNMARGYVLSLKTLGDDQTSKEEVRGFYEGKCQICNFTFRDREGNNYCKIVHLLPKSHQGVRFAGNLLCLCPNHAAMHQCRVVDYKGLKDLGSNGVNIKINGKAERIHFTNLHYRMFKTMFGIK